MGSARISTDSELREAVARVIEPGLCDGTVRKALIDAEVFRGGTELDASLRADITLSVAWSKALAKADELLTLFSERMGEGTRANAEEIKKGLNRIDSELSMIQGAVRGIAQDFDTFNGASKKLGSNALRALTSIQDRIALGVSQCADDARAILTALAETAAAGPSEGGGGNEVSVAESTDAPACGAAEDAQRKSEESYRGFRIDYDPPPIPVRDCDWHWTHEDYDGPEDNRYGHAPSLEAAKADIDFWHEENGDAVEAGKAEGNWKAAAKDLIYTLANERDRSIRLRTELITAREYVVDALDAHEHSDGRELLQRIDVALSEPASVLTDSPCKSEGEAS